MFEFSLQGNVPHLPKSIGTRLLFSGLMIFVTLSLPCQHVVADEASDSQADTAEYYRRTGLWIVPATMANRHGLAILATGSNAVSVNTVNGANDFPDQALLPKAVVNESSTIFASMPFSCLGLPPRNDIALGMNLTSFEQWLHIPISAFAAMPYLREHVIRLDPANGKVEILPAVDTSNGDLELTIKWENDRPTVPVGLPILGHRSFIVETGRSGYLALEADRAKALARMGHIFEHQLGETVQVDLATGKKSSSPATLSILRWLDFGGVRFHNVPVEIKQNDEIGLGLLHCFRTTLDFPGNRIRLERLTNADAVHVPRPGGGAALAFRDSDELVVDYLIEGSAAQRLGVEVDDRVLRLNGLTPQELSRHTIDEILSSTDKAASLHLQRADRQFHIDLNLEHPFPWPPAWEPELPTFDPDAETAE